MSDKTTFRFKPPEWLAKKYKRDVEWTHLVGLEHEGEDGTEYYKPILVNDDQERWWVWCDRSQMHYGPQFSDHERQALTIFAERLKNGWTPGQKTLALDRPISISAVLSFVSSEVADQ